MRIPKEYMQKIIDRPASYYVEYHGNPETGTCYIHALLAAGGDVLAGKTRPRGNQDVIRYVEKTGRNWLSITTNTGIDFPRLIFSKKNASKRRKKIF